MNDVRRIAFVSERFLELQGLGPACYGGMLIFSALLHKATGASGRHAGEFQALLFAMLAAGYAAIPLQKMYRRTFGDVVATPWQRFLAALPLQVFSVGALADILLSIDRPRSGPSIAAVAFAAQAASIVLRDWRWRAHHLIAVAAGVAAAIVTASLPSAPGLWGVDPPRTEAYLLSYTLIGLGMAASGLLDHLLLASTLRAGVVDVPVERPRRADAVVFTVTVALAAAVPAGVCLLLSDSSLPALQPLAFMIGLVLTAGALAIRQLVVAIRDFGRRPPAPDSGLRVDVDHDVVIAFLLIVIAAAADSALFSGRAPALSAAAIGLTGAWLAVTRWADRKHHLIWPVAAAVVLAVIPRVAPARAFAVFVVAMATALLLAAAAGRAASSHRFDHADTV